MFKIVLIEPEIPQNTGNIGRTCVAAGCELHLVGPMGFEITEQKVKRAGLDYWPHLKLFMYNNFEEWWSKLTPSCRLHFLSAKGQTPYDEAKFEKGDWLVFWKETKGLDPDLLRRNADRTLKIPLNENARSLNLATSVAVIAFEGLRQLKASPK